MISKKIGLFGGSFNPVHDAHIQLALTTKSELNLDEIWILIDKNPRNKNNIVPYDDRLSMVKLATSSQPSIVVDRLDIQKIGRTHNHKTILELKNQFPDFSFTMILGLDAMVHFSKWEAPEIFCENVDFAIAHRPPHTQQDFDLLRNSLGILSKKLKYKIIDFPQNTTSSTWIRNQLQTKRQSNEIHPEVQNYILDQGLYV